MLCRNRLNNMTYITKKDNEHAQAMSVRWESCSREARKFATYYSGKFVENILPHVVAECYDKDPNSTIIAALGSTVDLEEMKLWLSTN